MSNTEKKGAKNKKQLKTKEPLFSPKVKKLSKLGKWMQAHPNGLTVNYVDWKAILK